MKDKKGIAISNAFQKILDESNRKPNKIWLDKGSEVYNRSIKSWLEKTAIEMYSIFDVNLKLVLLLEYQNIKMFLQRLCSKLV